MCSGSLIYLLEEVTGGGQVKATAYFLLDFHQVQKESGRDKWTSLFPELTLEELVFLHHEYYSIFLLQQEASALWNTVGCDKQQWYLNWFLLGVKLRKELYEKSVFWNVSFVFFK
jgi:hypothetical protein